MFLGSTYFYNLSDCTDNLSSFVRVKESQFVIKLPVLLPTGIGSFIAKYPTNLYQFKYWEYCVQA